MLNQYKQERKKKKEREYNIVLIVNQNMPQDINISYCKFDRKTIRIINR